MCCHTRAHTHTHTWSSSNLLFTAWHCTPPLWGELGRSSKGGVYRMRSHILKYECNIWENVTNYNEQLGYWPLHSSETMCILMWNEWSCNQDRSLKKIWFHILWFSKGILIWAESTEMRLPRIYSHPSEILGVMVCRCNGMCCDIWALSGDKGKMREMGGLQVLWGL